MIKIVISYRRDDTEAITGRIYDRLCDRYGADSVFIDIDSIPPGVNFREFITKTMQDAGVLLAVMGTQWAGRTKNNKARIHSPSDFVRIEVEKAFEFGIPVIPVLVNGSTMLDASELPESLANLAFQNAIVVSSGLDFRQHADRLTRAIDRIASTRITGTSDARMPAPAQTKAAVLPLGNRKMLISLAVIALLSLAMGTVAVWRTIEQKPAETAKLVLPGDSKTVAVPCSEEKRLKSLGSITTTSMVFNNKINKPLRVYWLSHSGERVLYGEIKAGQSMYFSTFITHPWVITDRDDRCLGIYMPSTVKQDIDVTL